MMYIDGNYIQKSVFLNDPTIIANIIITLLASMSSTLNGLSTNIAGMKTQLRNYTNDQLRNNLPQLVVLYIQYNNIFHIQDTYIYTLFKLDHIKHILKYISQSNKVDDHYHNNGYQSNQS